MGVHQRGIVARGADLVLEKEKERGKLEVCEVGLFFDLMGQTQFILSIWVHEERVEIQKSWNTIVDLASFWPKRLGTSGWGNAAGSGRQGSKAVQGPLFKYAIARKVPKKNCHSLLTSHSDLGGSNSYSFPVSSFQPWGQGWILGGCYC